MSNGADGSRDLGIPGVVDAVLIGTGGSSRVYRATQGQLGRLVAVKVLIGADPAERKQFDRESRALGQLASHPGIVSVHDAGFTEMGDPYLMLQYCAGGSLSDRVDDHVMSWEEAVGFLAPVAETLAHAHDQGIVHRDLKPGNILLDDKRRPLIADFGLARLIGANTSAGQPSMAAFTPGYVPPETISGAPSTRAGDVYSLGGTLYSLLTGLVPYVDTESAMNIVALARRIAEDPVPDLRPHGVPEPVCQVIEQCMAKDPAVRPTASELAGQLHALLEPEPQRPTAQPPVATGNTLHLAPEELARPIETVAPSVLEGATSITPAPAAAAQTPMPPAPQSSGPVTGEVPKEPGKMMPRVKASLFGVIIGLLVLGLIALGVVGFYLLRGEELPAALGGGQDADAPVVIDTQANADERSVVPVPTPVVPPTPRPTVAPTPTPVPTATPVPTPSPVPTVERGIPVADLQTLIATPATVIEGGSHDIMLDGEGYAPGTDVLIVFCQLAGDTPLTLTTDVDELVSRIQGMNVEQDCDLNAADFIEVDPDGSFNVEATGTVGPNTIVLAGATDQSASAFVAIPIVP